MLKKLAVGGRLFECKSESSLKKIITFAKKYSKIAELVIIAINTVRDNFGAEQALKALKIENLIVIGVAPWGRVIPALNALVSEARLREMHTIAFLSTEISITADSLSVLNGHVDSKTLCAGARFMEHKFYPGELTGTGLTVPWNTACVWDLAKLSLIGFPLAGEALFDPTRETAGAEELATIAVMQFIYPHYKAKLVDVPGIYWANDFPDDSNRLKEHREKIASKTERSNKQLVWLLMFIGPGFSSPTVWHIQVS